MLEGWFESKEAKEKKHEVFEHTVFPLGPEHKAWIHNVIEKHLDGDTRTHVFLYLVVKEAYVNKADQDLEVLIQKEMKKQKIKWEQAQIDIFIKILRWDLEAKSIETLNKF